MAITFNTTGAALTRDGSFLDPAQDWTRFVWVQPVRVLTGTQYFALWLLGDDPAGYTPPWIYLGTPGAGGTFDLNSSSDPGSGAADTASVTMVEFTWLPVAVTYTASTTTLSFRSGPTMALAGNVTVDLSAVSPIVGERLGSDTGGSQPDLVVAYDRIWQAVLTPTQLIAETLVRVAARSTNILCDCPLTNVDTLTDLSGNGHDWASTGTITTFADPLPMMGGPFVEGDLAFTGYGDSGDMRFYSPQGVNRGQPTSLPNCGSGVDGIVGLITGHQYGIIGGNAPNFPNTGVGVFNPDFTVLAEGASGAHGFPGRSVARDTATHWYGLKDSTAYLFQFEIAGAQTTTWNLAPVAMKTWNSRALGVNNAATRAYYSVIDTSVIGAKFDTIRAWNLTGDVTLGVFVTETGYQVGHNSLVVLASGHVLVGWRKDGSGIGYLKEYDTSGALVQLYSLAGTTPTPLVLTPGLTSASVWVSYYNAAVSTYSGVTISEIELGTGTVLHTFEPEDTTFQFDSPFCVVVETFGGSDPPGPGTARVIRRLRQFSHISDDQVFLFWSNAQLVLEAGVGLSSGQGSDPQVMFSWSDDGGHTWSPELWVSAGLMGQYGRRCRLPGNLGQSRDRVWRIVVTDPVKWAMLGMLADLEKGTS